MGKTQPVEEPDRQPEVRNSSWTNRVLTEINQNSRDYPLDYSKKGMNKVSGREKFNPEKSNKEENRIGGWSWIENLNSFKR